MKKIVELKIAHNFDDYFKKCCDILFVQKPINFIYPKVLYNKNNTKKWDVNVNKIKKYNNKLLKSLRNNANVYVIHLLSNDKKWQKKYIGTRKSQGIRERITQHLIKKGTKTTAKLKQVQKALASNQKIGLTFIKIHPEELRYYFEAVIIQKFKNELKWNKNK